MKKLFAFVLAMMMLLMACSALAEAEFVDFEAKNTVMLIETFGLEKGGWYSSGLYRGMLTFFVSADYLTATGGDASKVDIEDSYVGYNEENEFYTVAFGYEDTYILALLCPDIDSYSYVDTLGVPIKDVLDGGASGFVYEKNTADDLNEVMDLVQKAM